MPIALSAVNLGSPVLKRTSFSFPSSVLNDDSELRTHDAVYSAHNTFSALLEGLELPEGLALLPEIGHCGNESSTRFIIKKVEPGRDRSYPGPALIFEFEADGKTGYNVSRWGIGKHSDEGHFYDKSKVGRDSRKEQNHHRTFGELKAEFEEFLQFVLPTLAEWEAEVIDSTFCSALNEEDLPPWFAQRAIFDLVTAQNQEAVEIDDVQIGRDDALEFARQNMVKAVKLPGKTFKLVGAD